MSVPQATSTTMPQACRNGIIVSGYGGGDDNRGIDSYGYVDGKTVTVDGKTVNIDGSGNGDGSGKWLR